MGVTVPFVSACIHLAGVLIAHTMHAQARILGTARQRGWRVISYRTLDKNNVAARIDGVGVVLGKTTADRGVIIYHEAAAKLMAHPRLAQKLINFASFE